MIKSKIVFVWRFQTNNCGDLASSPWNYLYFGSHSVERIDLAKDLRSSEVMALLEGSDLIVIGGGGLIGLTKYNAKLSYLIDRYSEKIIVWGAGSNWHNAPGQLPDLGKCCWSGIRDFPLSVTYKEFPPMALDRTTYLPCASVLDTYFLSYWKDKISSEIQRFLPSQSKRPVRILLVSNDAGNSKGSIFTSSFIEKLQKLFENSFNCSFLHIGNSKIKMTSCLDVIQSADLIFTRSYHFAYWSLLMGKPVIGIRTTSKFDSFPLKYSKYMLFSSLGKTIEFFESFEKSKLEDFVEGFIYDSIPYQGICFYMQSLLLNCFASQVIYQAIEDVESSEMFAAKYTNFLAALPYRYCAEIGVNSPIPDMKHSKICNFSKNNFTALEMQDLDAIFAHEMPAVANVIAESAEHDLNNQEEVNKYNALSKIRMMLSQYINHSLM